MLHFLGKYSHWLLLISLFISLAISLFSGQYDAASMAFGFIGLSGVAYLVYRIEADRKKKKLQE